MEVKLLSDQPSESVRADGQVWRLNRGAKLKPFRSDGLENLTATEGCAKIEEVDVREIDAFSQ